MAYGKKYEGPTALDKAFDTFAEMFINRLKEMKESNWEKPWISENALGWPRNLDGRKYNGSNALMLMLVAQKEGYTRPIYGTFNRIAALNYKKQGDERVRLTDEEGNNLPTVLINKGAKSVPVVLVSYTVVHNTTREKIPYEDYKNLSKEDRMDYKVYPKMNVYFVFNIDQTNLAESRPELYAKLTEQPKSKVKSADEMFSFESLDAMIEHGLWHCPIETTGENAYFSPSQDKVVLPPKEKFFTGEQFTSTAFHEMVHSTGAKERLNRLVQGAHFGSTEYATEELVAELGAALVAAHYGIEKPLSEHIKNGECVHENTGVLETESLNYVKAWIEQLDDNPDILKKLLPDVKKAASMVIERTDKIQELMDIGANLSLYDRDMIATAIELDSEGEEVSTHKGMGR